MRGDNQIAFGRGKRLPNALMCFVKSFFATTFIGEPWPINMAGIFFPSLITPNSPWRRYDRLSQHQPDAKQKMPSKAVQLPERHR